VAILANGLNDLEPIHTRHAYIRDQKIKTALGKEPERFLSAARNRRIITSLPEQDLDGSPYQSIIIHRQDPFLPVLRFMFDHYHPSIPLVTPHKLPLGQDVPQHGLE
jgi:hypothetical protein